MTGIVFGAVASSGVEVDINSDIIQINSANKEQKIKEINLGKVYEPTPLDNYNKQTSKSFKIRRSNVLLSEKHITFTSRIFSNSIFSFRDK